MPPSAPSTRIRAFDWLRGGVTILMVQHHAEDLLLPALRQSARAAQIDWVDGLVAPSFLLTAGFALGLTQVRAGGDLGRAKKSFWRIMEVLLAATFVNWMWFPIFREPRWIGRIDILQCIGLSLLFLLPLLVLLARKPLLLSGTVVALGLGIFFAAPFAEHVKGPFAQLLNIQSGASFPLLPWMGHVALGVALGAAAAHSRRALVWALALIGSLGVAVRLLRPVFIAVLPPHDFWVTDPSTHGDRWAMVCAIALGFLAIERRFPDRPGPRLIAFFSNHSLSAYVFHEALLYYVVFGFSFFWIWGKRAGWGEYLLLTIALLFCTWALCRVWDVVDPIGRKILRAPFSRHARSTAS